MLTKVCIACKFNLAKFIDASLVFWIIQNTVFSQCRGSSTVLTFLIFVIRTVDHPRFLFHWVDLLHCCRLWHKIQGFMIFHSPNCSRPAIIPPQTNYSSPPFNQPHLNSSMFKQPIWWTEFWGWLSFIPLAPSFTSTPFMLFSWTFQIEQVEVSFNYRPG